MRPGRTDLEENLRTSKSKKFPTTLPRRASSVMWSHWRTTSLRWPRFSHEMWDSVVSFVCWLTSHSRIFCSYRIVTIDGEGLKNLFRPTSGLSAGKDLYRATPAVARGLGFCGLVQRTAQIKSPLTTSKGYWWPNPAPISFTVFS